MISRSVGIELEGIIECMDCVVDKEEDYILDQAVVEGRFIMAGEAEDKDLKCSICGKPLAGREDK